jgi:hypothetical protein
MQRSPRAVTLGGTHIGCPVEGVLLRDYHEWVHLGWDAVVPGGVRRIVHRGGDTVNGIPWSGLLEGSPGKVLPKESPRGCLLDGVPWMESPAERPAEEGCGMSAG